MSVPQPLIDAVNALRQGQLGAAEAALAPLLAAKPNHPDALHVLGDIRTLQRRLEDAQTCYRASLAAAPAQPQVLLKLGQAIANSGRLNEALELWRAARDMAPSLFDVQVQYAQGLAAAGRFAEAEAPFRAALALQPHNAAAISGLGAVLNELSRSDEAERILRQPANDPPPQWSARIAHNLGVALIKQGRHQEALSAFDTAIAAAPRYALSHFNRAASLEHLGRADDAVDAYRHVLAQEPANPHAHEALNALLYRMGRDQDFLKSYDEALSHAPGDANLLMDKARFLMRAERYAEARDNFERVAFLAPNKPTVLNGIASAQAALGETGAAIAAYEKSLALQPNDAETQLSFAATLLEAEEAARALALTDALVRRLPLDQSALAVHEVALRATNDARGDALANYDRHIQIFDLAPPEGYASMADFNADLNAYLDTLHTDLREHVDQTLRKGTQTIEPLLDGDAPVIRALRQRLEEGIAAYIAAMKENDARHPLASRRASGFDFSGSWSSRLRDAGFHTNHIHALGWISSCYYVDVPEVAADTDAQQGWIKFGEPNFAAKLATPIRRTVQPKPGLLVLFPSYMWHGTTPFRSAQSRTTVAFDVVPKS